MRAMLLALLMAGSAWAAAPPARLTAEQEKLLLERNTLYANGIRAWQAGRQAEAIAAAEKSLALQLRQYGPWHHTTDIIASALADWHQAREEWREELKYRRIVLEARLRLYGPVSYTIVDARLDIEEALAQPKQSPEKRAALARSDRLGRQAVALYNAGRAARAVPLAKEAAELALRALGEKHRQSARCLNNLGAVYKGAGNNRAALAQFNRALAICKDVVGENHPTYARTLNNLATVYRNTGRPLTALSLFKRSLAITRQTRGEGGPDYANTLGNLASLYHDLGDHGAALPLFKKSLEITRAKTGEKHPLYAIRLNNLALLLKDMGDHKAALVQFLRSRDIVEATLGKRHPNYATCLHNLGDVYTLTGDHKAAREHYEQALEVLRDTVGVKHPLYGNTLNNLAQLQRATGDYRLALSSLEKALAIRENALGANHPDCAQSHNALGALYRTKGQYTQALSHFERALEIMKGAVGGDHPEYAVSLGNLAGLYRETGDFKAALPLFRKSLAIYKLALGEKHHLYAEGLNNLGQLYKEMGLYAASLPLHQQALAARKVALGEKHLKYAQSLENLAALYAAMGDYKAALPLLKQAVDINKGGRGEQRRQYAGGLLGLASLYQEMGDLKAALPLCRQAGNAVKGLLGERHAEYATCLNNLAELQAALGEHKQALQLHEKALAIRKEALGEKHPLYADSLNNLAGLHQSAGKRKLALRLYWQALEVTKVARGADHTEYSQALNNLATVYAETDHPGAALRLMEQALSITRRGLARGYAIQSERQQRAALEARRRQLDNRLSMPDEAARFSHDHVLSWKGAGFSAQQARRRFLVAEKAPATRRLALKLQEATRSLALLRSREDAASKARAEELLQEKEALEVELSRLSAPFREALSPPSSESFRASLPKGAVLIDLLVHTGTDPAQPGRGERRSRLLAWVVRPDAPTVRVNLGPVGPIQEAITSWRRAIESGREAGTTPARLRELVWSPLEKHLGGAKVVLVSPDGGLGKLPFCALPGKEKGKYLLEEVPLAVLPVPQALPEVLKAPTSKPSILAVGGVEFGGAGTWPALPATGQEARDVAARCRARFRAGHASLSGRGATKAALSAALPKHRFAHLATHGFFASPSMKSYLQRGKKGGRGRLDLEGLTGWEPGLLSGVVLAGANGPTEEDNGILTALEIAELDLSEVELAVLSACQTGLGEESAAEGMLGLQRAFAVAGCKSVVSSLWSVHDAATGVLMERFYYHLWDGKKSKLEALRQAQLDVMRHPEWVEERATKLRGLRGLRGIGKVSEKVVAGKKQRRSPVAWWAAWQLSGDWR